jgi:PKD repeat protein
MTNAGIPVCALGRFVRTAASASFRLGWLLFCSSMVFAQSVTIAPTSINFPSQVIGTTSSPRRATLTNTGTAPLTIESIVTSGDFSQTNTCRRTIAPSKKCTIEITFAPEASGPKTGNVTVKTRGPGGPFVLSLSGDGIPPVSLSESVITFGDIIVGSSSAGKSVTLTNHQAVPLNISSIIPTGNFAESSTCGNTLEAKGHCKITVTFSPTASGARHGRVVVTDDAGKGRQIIVLSGTGVPAVLVKLTVNPDAITLGTRQTQQFTAIGTYDNKTTKDLTKSVSWNIRQGDEGGRISRTGLYTAPSSLGTFTIFATNSNPPKRDAATVTVVAHQPPVANPGGPYAGNAKQSIAFDGSKSSDPNGLPLTYSWNFGDGNSGTGVSPTHNYFAFGAYTVTLKVSDSLGGTNSATTTASIDALPVANPGGPYTGSVNQSISFDGSKSNDPDNDPLTYSWTFGDQGTGTGIRPTHTYTAEGTYTVALTVNDGRGGTNTATTQATIPTTGTAPVVNITSPVALTLLNSTPIAVTGTVDNSADIIVVNGIAATVSNGIFTAQNVPLGEGPNLLTATASDPNGNIGTASISVTLDTTPPHVTIGTPANGSVVTSSTVTVSGMISDVVLGTVNAQQASVTVNGIAAQVSNRSYLVNAVPLSAGPNTLTAIGKDAAGNTASTSITVVFSPPTDQPTVNLVSGNNQTAVIGSPLSSPLVVALKDASSNPVQGQTVVFRITANNGTLTAPGAVASPDGRSVAVTTDANGMAQASWTLGMRAGAGNNVVKAAAANFTGEVNFTAIALQGTPGMISLDAGNNQTGAVGQALPRPFVVAVTDAGHNRLPNIPVTFTVKQGGGTINGPVTMNTDSDGHATSILLLGQQEGIANNLVEANFAGNTGFPVTFTASGKVAGNPANTQISGVVLDNTNIPIAGITLSVEGTPVTTQSDLQGQFVLKGVPVGTVKLKADGGTAARPGSWPTMVYELVTIAGQNNTIGMPIYLLPLNLPEGLQVDAMHGGTITLAEVPGFSLTVAPGSVTFPDGTNSGIVSVTLVHADKVPMTPNFGQQPRFIVSIQPAGSHFNPPAPMSIPNVDGLKPGEVTEMYSFDHDLGSFVAIGTGTVSADGTVVKSDPGVGIIKGGWHCGGNPTQGGTASNCGTCQTCNGNTCIPNPTGTNCGACWSAGTCSGSGTCSGGTPVPAGASCGGCSNGGICDGNGNCINGVASGNGSNCGPCWSSGTCQNGACDGGTQAPPGTTCNPNACVTGAACDNSGACTGGTPVVCGGDVCAGPETCDPTSGACISSGPSPPGGASCDVCTTGAACANGACSGGTPLQAGSSCGGCTVGGSCDGAGHCSGGASAQNGTSCGPCYQAGAGSCQNGVCVGGTPLQNGTSCGTNGMCSNGTCLEVNVVWRPDNPVVPTPNIVLIHQGSHYSGSSVAAVLGPSTPFGGNFVWSSADDTIVSVSQDSNVPDGHVAMMTGLRPGITSVKVTYSLAGAAVSSIVGVQVFYPIMLVHGFNSSGPEAWEGPGSLGEELQRRSLLKGDFNCDASDGLSGDVDFCAVDFSTLLPWGSFSSFIEEGSLLGLTIAHLRQVTGSSDVNVLAHSMGGLVTRSYLESGGTGVANFITIGTPNLGTPLADLATDPTLKNSLARQLLQGLQPDSPADQGMSLHPPPPLCSDICGLDSPGNVARLPFGTHYISVVGDATVTEATLESAAWTTLITADCAIDPTGDVCLDLTLRSPGMYAFFFNSDLVVGADSQNLGSVSGAPSPCVELVQGVTHAPVPVPYLGSVFSPSETSLVNTFVSVLDFERTTDCVVLP